MPISILPYLQKFFPHLPLEHWAVMGVIVLALVLYLSIWKKTTVFGAIALGLTVLVGLFLLDAMVLRRIGVQIEQHPEFDIVAEYRRLFHSDEEHRVQMLFNVAVFIPFGLCLSAFLSAAKHCKGWRNVGRVALAAFLFSLCIESLQWILRVGIFEITDIILNTIGALLGAAFSLGVISMIKSNDR